MIQAHPGQATTGLVAATREEATLGRNFSTFVYKALRMGVLNSAGNNKDGLKHLGCNLLLSAREASRVASTFKVTPITLMASFTWGWLVHCASSSQIHTPREQIAMHLFKKDKKIKGLMKLSVLF